MGTVEEEEAETAGAAAVLLLVFPLLSGAASALAVEGPESKYTLFLILWCFGVSWLTFPTFRPGKEKNKFRDIEKPRLTISVRHRHSLSLLLLLFLLLLHHRHSSSSRSRRGCRGRSGRRGVSREAELKTISLFITLILL